MFNFQNLTNTRGTGISTNANEADIKVFANNRIRVNLTGRAKIGLEGDRNILIQKNMEDNKLYIASVDKDSGVGRPVNNKGEFNHALLNEQLGGQHSEWEIVGEGNEFQGVKYFELQQTKNGEEERNKIEAIAKNEEPAKEEDEEGFGIKSEEESAENVEEEQVSESNTNDNYPSSWDLNNQ